MQINTKFMIPELNLMYHSKCYKMCDVIILRSCHNGSSSMKLFYLGHICH